MLPDGLGYQWNSNVVCSGCASGPSLVNLGADNPSSTTTRIGMYLGAVSTDASPATITWTYSAYANRNFNTGALIPEGHVFTNTAELRANIVDRLGGVAPRLNTLRPADFQLQSVETVLVGSPKLAIEKRAISPSPLDPGTGKIEWEVTLTNSGPVEARNVYVYDDDVSPNPGLYTSQIEMLSPVADFFQLSSNLMGVKSVPANGTYTFRFKTDWYPSNWMGYSPEDYRLTNRVYVNQYQDPFGANVPINTTIESRATVQLLSPDVAVTKELISAPIVAVGTPLDYRVTLTNNGLGSAANFTINDYLPAGTGAVSVLSATPAGSVSCSGTGTATCTLTPNTLAPGATVTFDYRVPTTSATTGVKTNNLQVRYTDGANRRGRTTSTGDVEYYAQQSVNATLVAPQMTLAKTPELDDPGATIPVLGSAKFYLVATNTGNYIASNATITDPLPAHLTADLAASTCVVFPATPSSGCVISGTVTQPVFTVASLAPGAEMRVELSVIHDGSDPKVVGSELSNIATLSAIGFTSITDDGGLNVEAGAKPPLPSKSVSPASAGPGETVTYTVDVSLRSATAWVYDATLIDTVPDGLENITPVSISCIAGSCPATLAYIGFEPSANGGGRAGWFIGDQPLLTTGTVRVVYTARVASQFVGGGVPAAGVPVRDGVLLGDPLRNAARIWFNDGVDRFATAPGSVPGTSTATFTSRSVNSRAALDIATPVIGLQKTSALASIEAGDRSNVPSINTYTLTVTNSGTRSAYNVDVNDSMANGELRDVVFDTLPSGVSVTNPWTLADPATTLRVDEVPAGATVTITYTAVPRTTAEVTDSRYLVRNVAQMVGFQSTPGGSGAGNYTYPGLSTIFADTYVFTPQPRLGASGCSDPDAVGDRREFQVDVSNWHYLGTPDRPNVGTLRNGILTVTLQSNVAFVPGTVIGTPFGGSEAPYRDPDSLTVNGDGTTTMVWNIGDVPINNGQRFLGLRWTVEATAIGVSGPTAVLSGTDWSGAATRGSAVGATTPYSVAGSAGCSVVYSIQKSPDGGTYPAGSNVNWSATYTISTPLHHAATVTGSLVDYLPKGFMYTPGSATFSDGTTAGSHAEVITALADGRTQITWSGFSLTTQPRSSRSISVTIPTQTQSEAVLTLDGVLPRTFTNQIGFEATSPTGIGSACGTGLTNAICDTGWVTVESNNQPTITKAVDHPRGPWGDTATFTMDISVPKNYATPGLFVQDQAWVSNPGTPYWPTNQPQLGFAPVSATCIAGCTAGGPDDIVVTSLPSSPNGNSLYVAWKTGAIAADTEARTLRIVYQTPTPGADEIALLPNCNAYGFALDSYYSCGRAVFFNQAQLYNANSSLDYLGAGWASNYWWAGLNHRGTATATFEARAPEVKITKRCAKPGEPFDGTGTNWNDPTALTDTALGVANVNCELTVVNVGPGTAYYINFDDVPAANSYWGWQMTWDIRSNTTPVGGTVDTAPTNGSKIAWEVPELAEGASYVVSFEARASLPSWATGIRFQSSPFDGSKFQNQARITSYDVDDFDTAHVRSVTGNRLASSYLKISTPRINLAKQVNPSVGPDVATQIDGDHCYGWERLQSGTNFACFRQKDNRQFLASDQALDYHVNIGLADASELRTVNVADRIPLGWSYVPGSARLDHSTWNAAGDLVTTSTPLFEPTLTPSSWSTCYYWNVNGSGDNLQWVFSRAGTGTQAAMWDDSLKWTGAVSGTNHAYDKTYRISYQLVPNSLWPSCKVAAHNNWSPGTEFYNQVQLDATTTADLSGSTSTNVNTRMISPPTFTKNPKNGTISAPSTANFTMDVDIPQRFGITGATVTDTIYDWSPTANAPLYQPGTATFTDEFGDPVTFTENVTHRSTGPTDPTTITWTFDTQPAYRYWENPKSAPLNQCPVSVTPATPYWGNCASRVHISLPISIPDDEPDGHVYDNSAVLVLPDVNYQPTDGEYAGIPAFNYGFTLTDTGSIRVVNPSPAPPASKWGPSYVTPNDEADYGIQVVIPSGTTYHDLAYTDVVPDGLEVLSIINKSCSTSTGVPCPAMTRTTLGPVVNADGTTTIGEFYDELGGVPFDRYISFTVHTRVKDQYSNGDRLLKGDQLTDRVTGYSNEDDLISSVPAAPVTTALYISQPATFTSLVDEPDVRIDKVADRPGPLAAGDEVNYTITVTNQSNVTAYRVPVEDHPNGALINVELRGDTSMATKGWVPDDPSLAWEIPELYPYQTYQFDYRATVGPDPQTEAAIVNTADVGVYQARRDASPLNREYDGPSDTVTIRFLSANLQVAKVPNPTAADPCVANDPAADSQMTSIGRPTPWCVTVTNAGELTAGAVVSRDMLALGWTYQAGSATVDGVAVEPVVTSLFGLVLLRWDLGDMAAGTARVIRYNAIPGATTSTTSVNTAWATAQRPDGSPPPAGAPGFRSTDTASAELSSVGVEISKTPDRQVLPFVPGGGRAVWQININNPAQTDLTGLVVIDHFPAGVVYDPATTVSTCADSVEVADPIAPAGDQVVRWSFPLLRVGESCAISVEAAVPVGLTGQTTILNDAQVDTDQTAVTVANQAKLVAYRPVTLGDLVWHDLNGNGIQEAGEPGYENARVTVSGTDIEGNAFSQSVNTDASGNWTMLTPPGTFTVSIDQSTLPSSSSFTLRTIGADATVDSNSDENGILGTITVASGDSNISLDAGFFRSVGSISGVRWHDLNADGIRQSTEPAIAGETVTISGSDTAGNSGSLTTVTDGNGYYEFTDLPPVTFRITFDEPPSSHRSPSNVGTDDTVDSDADLVGGFIDGFLASGENRNNVDEGTYELGGVVGYAWNDTNGDGVRDTTEPMRDGVSVTLTGIDGTGASVTLVGTTDSSGYVAFKDLVPGTYTLTYAPSSSDQFTALNSGSDDKVDSDVDRASGAAPAVSVESGTGINGGDAGYFTPVALSGRAWDDANGDGIQDSSELARQGVTVTLVGTDGAGNPVSATTATAADGSYSFTGLAPGTYHVVFTTPNGERLTIAGQGTAITGSDADETTGETAAVTLVSGDTAQNLDAGFYAPATVGDRIWEDLNGNGNQDGGEPGVSGLTVTVTGTDGAGRTVSESATTDGTGTWSVAGLAPGTFTVTFAKPAGAEFTTLGAGTAATDSNAGVGDGKASVTLVSGQTDSSIDAGVYTPGSVSGTLWFDSDGDGVREGAETLLSGVVVHLTGTDGAGNPVSLTATTNSSGFYEFLDLAPGSYVVTPELPGGRTLTVNGLGTDPLKDSDLDPVTGSRAVTVTSGSSSQIDGGLIAGAALGGRAWEDRDNDGIQESGEPSRGGVEVTITGTDGAGRSVTRTTTTAADGSWSVTVPPGTYVAHVAVAPGSVLVAQHAVGASSTTDSDFDPTSANSAPVTVRADDVVSNIDAGYFVPASISGVVWNDRNGNGIQDDGVLPIAGVLVTLVGTDVNGNAVSLMTVSDADGNWKFADLAQGSYTVTTASHTGYEKAPVDTGSDDAIDSDPSVVTVNLVAGTDVAHLDHGFWQPASLAGVAWADTNRDGIRQKDEALLKDVAVELVVASNSAPRAFDLVNGAAAPGSSIATQQTASDGSYYFGNLAPGDYQVRVVTPSGHKITMMDVGADNSVDSDFNETSLFTNSMSIVPGMHVINVDAGFWTPTNISLVKSVVAGPTADRQVTYRLRTTNEGNQPTIGLVSVTDELPEALSVVSYDAAGWVCEQTITAVTCSSAEPLAPGKYHDLILVGRIADNFSGKLVNTAFIGSKELTDNSTKSDDTGNAAVEGVVTARSPETPAGVPSRQLAFTGSNILVLIMLAGASMLLGGSALGARRRRRDQ